MLRRLYTRLKADVMAVGELLQNPRLLLPWLRSTLLRIWRSRGGGFYGLGYLLYFVVLELRMFAGELTGSDSVSDFISSQLLEYLFRFGLQSLINGVLALAWPAFVVERFGAMGLAMLVAGYWLFGYFLRARLQAWLPELKPEKKSKSEPVSRS